MIRIIFGDDAFCNIRKYFEMFKMTKMLDISSKKWWGWHCFSCDFHIHRRNFDAICIVTKENIVPYTMLLKISFQLPHESSNLLQLIYNELSNPCIIKYEQLGIYKTITMLLSLLNLKKLNLVLYFHISFISFTTRQRDKVTNRRNLKCKSLSSVF